MSWRERLGRNWGRLGMKYKLSEIMDIIGGGTPKTSKPEYWNGNIPWLSVKDFNNDYRYVYETEKTITQAGLDNSSTKLLKRNDSIISARGTVGEMAMISYPMAFNQSCYGLRAKEGLVDEEYLYYLIKHNVVVLKKNTHGSVFDTITRDTFDGIEVDLPSLVEQKVVASILRDLDDKIELNNAINNNLEQQVTTAFYNMFGKYEQISNTHKPLSTIAKFKYGTMPKKDKLGTGHYHAFSGYQIVGTYPEVMFENPQLIIVARGVGGCGDVKYTPANCYLTNLSIAIITEKTMHDDYLYHYLRLHDTKIMNTGSAQPQITVATLEKIEIPIPPEEEMIRFSDFVQPFKQQYRNNQDENKLLSKLRDTLLSKLMSGELDISDIDI